MNFCVVFDFGTFLFFPFPLIQLFGISHLNLHLIRFLTSSMHTLAIFYHSQSIQLLLFRSSFSFYSYNVHHHNHSYSFRFFFPYNMPKLFQYFIFHLVHDRRHTTPMLHLIYSFLILYFLVTLLIYMSILIFAIPTHPLLCFLVNCLTFRTEVVFHSIQHFTYSSYNKN